MAEQEAGEAEKAQGALTPGARLAAAKAAKAAAKAAKRGRMMAAPRIFGSAQWKRTETAFRWIQAHRVRVAMFGIVLATIGALVTLWSSSTRKSRKEEMSLLTAAAETATRALASEVREPAQDKKKTFSSLRERARAAAAAFAKDLRNYPHSEASIWARLGEAAAWMQAGEVDKGAKLDRQALESRFRDTFSKSIVLEGLAFASEAKEKWADAEATLLDLRRLGDGAYQDLADYHLARVQLAKGDAPAAKKTLTSLLARVAKLQDPDQEGGSSYVRDHAEGLMKSLDPTFSGGTPSRAEIDRIMQKLRLNQPGL